MKQFNNLKSFTLIELLVSMAIILVVSGILLPNYHSVAEQFSLLRTAYQVSQNIRRVQEMATSAKEFDCVDAVGLEYRLQGYGIHFKDEQESYSLMARCEKLGLPFVDVEKEQIDLPRVVKIHGLEQDGIGTSVVDIFFYPPNPETDLLGADNVEITVCLKKNLAKKETIKVNKAGLIYVE